MPALRRLFPGRNDLLFVARQNPVSPFLVRGWFDRPGGFSTLDRSRPHGRRALSAVLRRLCAQFFSLPMVAARRFLLWPVSLRLAHPATHRAMVRPFSHRLDFLSARLRRDRTLCRRQLVYDRRPVSASEVRAACPGPRFWFA